MSSVDSSISPFPAPVSALVIVGDAVVSRRAHEIAAALRETLGADANVDVEYTIADGVFRLARGYDVVVVSVEHRAAFVTPSTSAMSILRAGASVSSVFVLISAQDAHTDAYLGAGAADVSVIGSSAALSARMRSWTAVAVLKRLGPDAAEPPAPGTPNFHDVRASNVPLTSTAAGPRASPKSHARGKASVRNQLDETLDAHDADSWMEAVATLPAEVRETVHGMVSAALSSLQGGRILEADLRYRISWMPVAVQEWLIDSYCGGQLAPSRRQSLGPASRSRSRRTATVTFASAVDTWDFNMFDFQPDELKEIIFHAFHQIGLVRECNMDARTLVNFISRISRAYNPVPYHGWEHAFDVFQASVALLIRSGASDVLTSVETLALFTSALGHDADHPGLDNNYLIRAQHALAVLYNDVSPLENRHASLTARILSDSETNVLAGLGKDEAAFARRAIVKSILWTDNARHLEMLSKVKALGMTMESFPDKDDDRLLFLALLLHSADVSNPARSFDLSVLWTNRLRDEYGTQATLEAERGLPISPLGDRSNPAPKLTIGFVDFIVSPLYSVLLDVAPGVAGIVRQLEANRAKWEQVAEKEQAASAAAAASPRRQPAFRPKSAWA